MKNIKVIKKIRWWNILHSLVKTKIYIFYLMYIRPVVGTSICKLVWVYNNENQSLVEYKEDAFISTNCTYYILGDF